MDKPPERLNVTKITREHAFIEAYWLSKSNMSVQKRIGCVTPKRIMASRNGIGYPWISTNRNNEDRYNNSLYSVL